MKWPSKVLMVNPTGFDVKYAINPHMLDESGNLNKVNSGKAFEQWDILKSTFEGLGVEVSVIKGDESLPDMVFTANQTLPFLKNGKTQVIMSKMNSTHRQAEVEFFKKWASSNNIEIYNYKTEETFEGMGDALWNYETGELFGGSGFRTSDKVYNEIEEIIEQPVHRLKLVSEDFYHLDTCLAIVNKDTAFAVKEGFDQNSFKLLKTKFKNLIEIPLKEAVSGFAGNLCAVKGKSVIIQKGNEYTISKAKECGLDVYEVETSEFIKSGGSVFCMKQLYW